MWIIYIDLFQISKEKKNDNLLGDLVQILIIGNCFSRQYFSDDLICYILYFLYYSDQNNIWLYKLKIFWYFYDIYKFETECKALTEIFSSAHVRYPVIITLFIDNNKTCTSHPCALFCRSLIQTISLPISSGHLSPLLILHYLWSTLSSLKNKQTNKQTKTFWSHLKLFIFEFYKFRFVMNWGRYSFCSNFCLCLNIDHVAWFVLKVINIFLLMAHVSFA